MISYEDISVVIQGPIHREPRESHNGCSTSNSIKSVRQHLPGASIILSTWKGENCDDLDADQFIFNEDPGPIHKSISGPWEAHNNLNRQIVSTLNGIKAVTTPYALKFRGDQSLNNGQLAKLFSASDTKSPNTQLESKIIASSWHTLDSSLYPSPFRVSDLVQFGRTNDLINYWNTPLAPNPLSNGTNDTSAWIKFYKIPGVRILAYAPEQYLFVSFLMRTEYLSSKDRIYFSDKEFWHSSAKALYDHFLIFDPDDLGVLHPSRMANKTDLYSSQSFASKADLSIETNYQPSLLRQLSASFLSLTYPDKPLFVRFLAVLFRNPKKIGHLFKGPTL